MRKTLLTALLAALAVLAACGEDESGPEEPLAETGASEEEDAEIDAEESAPIEPDEAPDADEGPEESAEEPDPAPNGNGNGNGGEASGPDAAGTFSTETVETDDFPSLDGSTVLLADIRVGAHDGFDRVVMEFDGDDTPSYRVAYVDAPVTEDGSGEELAIDGNAFLELRLTPAAGVDMREAEPQVTFEGDRVDGSAGSAVRELVRRGDFEANLAWVVGLDEERGFAVEVLQNPLRLVVDIEH